MVQFPNERAVPTPIFHHDLFNTDTPCYVIDQTRNICTATRQQPPPFKKLRNNLVSFGCVTDRQLQDLLRGSSSLTTVGDIVIRTSAVPCGGSYGLLVSAVNGRTTEVLLNAKFRWGNNIVQSSSLSTVDNNSVSIGKSSSIIISLHATVNEDGGVIELNVLDDMGCVTMLSFFRDSNGIWNVNTDEVRCNELPVLRHNGERLNTSNCTWLSNNVVVIGTYMSSELYCCNVLSGECVDWDGKYDTVSQSLLRRVSGVFTPSRSRVPDMAPCAALCHLQAVSGCKSSAAGCWLFSVHTDGSMRMWKCYAATSTLNYDEVHELPEEAVFQEDYSSSTSNAVQICVRRYLEGEGFVLGIGIQTKLVDEINGGRLFWTAVVYGPLSLGPGFKDDVRLEELNSLSNRSDLETLHSLSFADIQRISLHYLYSTTFSTTVIYTFEPSQLSILRKDPVCIDLVPLGGFTNSNEYEFENDVCVITNIKGDVMTDLKLIDKIMIRRLFRPTNAFPPSSTNVIRALNRFAKSFTQQNISIDLDGSSIAAIVLKVIRQYYNQSRNMHLRKKTSNTSTKYHKNADVYKKFAKSSEDDQLKEDSTLSNYYSHWKKLFQIVAEEEIWMRKSLQLSFVGSNAFVLQVITASSVNLKSLRYKESPDFLILELMQSMSSRSYISRVRSRLEMLVQSAGIVFDDKREALFEEVKNIKDSFDVPYSWSGNGELIFNEFKVFLANLPREDLSRWLLSPLMASNEGQDCSTTLIKDRESVGYGPVTICGLRVYLGVAMERGFARCVIGSLLRDDSLIKNSIKLLFQVMALQWIVANASACDMKEALAVCLRTGNTLSRNIHETVSLFLSDGFSTKASNYLKPSLALRLLAPISSFSTPFIDDDKFFEDAKKRLAHCIVEEVRSCRSEMIHQKQLMYAADLYFGSFSSKLQKGTVSEVHKVVKLLVERGNKDSKLAPAELAESLKFIYPEIDRETCQSISEISCVLRILSRLVVAGQCTQSLQEVDNVLIKQDLPGLSIFVNQSILLCHGLKSISMFNNCGMVGLFCVKKVLSILADFFPEDIMRDMDETSVLYHAALEFSLDASEWDDAFDACTRQPIIETKVLDFNRLVVSMVSHGHLDKLLSLRLDADISTDWYAHAVKTLRERCNSDDNTVDWVGCLFSLQASRDDWRGASEVILNFSRKYPLSYIAGRFAMQNIPECSSRLIFVGEYEATRVKRCRADCLLSEEDVRIRSIAYSCEGLLEKEDVIEPISSVCKVMIQTLTSHGYILQALCLADASLKGEISSQAVSEILCENLVPIATGIRKGNLPLLQFMVGNPERNSDCESLAMLLLERYTTALANSSNFLSINVAEAILRDSGSDNLPSWLTDLLEGTSPNAGLFASHMSSSKSNPHALLKLYTRVGLLVNACKLVTKILGDTASTEKLICTPPEKGGICYVPIDDIDLLWNICDVALKMETSKRTKSLNFAREEMGEAITKHLRSMGTKDSAVLSARAIAQS